MKRILAMLLVLVTICGLLPISALAATPDGTGPVLKTLKLEKTTVTAPGTVEVIATATDDVSGVKGMYVSFRSEELNESYACFLKRTYYDETVHDYVEYSDGKWHGTIEVDEYQENGTFKLYRCEVYDVAGNYTYYYNDPDTTREYFPSSMRDLKFKVKETNPDTKGPTLKSGSISKTSLKAPGSFEVTAKVTDDISGVRGVTFRFYCEAKNSIFSVSLDDEYYDYDLHQYVKYEDGLWHGTREIAEDFEPGTYIMDSITVSDEAGNYTDYDRTPVSDQKALPSSVKDLKIKITGEGPIEEEKVPPVLKSLTISKENVHAPGTIEVIANATDADSGVDYICVRFKCDELGDSYYGYLYNTYRDPNTGEKVKYADGKWHGTIETSEYQEPGVFDLDYVYIRDMVGNYVYYDRDPYGNDKPLPSYAQGMKFKVLNGGTTAYLYRDYVQMDEEVFAEVSVTGENLKYQWYFKNSGDEKYSKSSVTGPLYSTTMSSKSRNRKLYCVVTHPDGKTTKTNTVTLRLATTIKTQPKNASAPLDETVKTSVKALGDGLKYQWYIKNAGSKKYSKSSITSATYSCKMTEKSKDRYVYCIVTDKYGNAEKTKTVVLRMEASIATQPKTTYTQSGEKVKVSVKALGDGLKYQWYVKNAGEDSYSKSSITKSTYSVEMSSKSKDRRVYCVVTDKYGNKVKTKTVVMRMAATITTEPKSVTVAKGKTAKTTVKAVGDELEYQWYVKNPGSDKYTKSSITSKTYSCTMSSKIDGRKVYCVVTDKYGKTDKSKTVTLYMD